MLAKYPLVPIMAVAVMAPLLAEIRIGARLPVVVLEVLLGIVIGPHVLGWVQPGPALSPGGFLWAMFIIGLAAVLFMAGMEIDFDRIRGRPLSLASLGWAASAGLGLVFVLLLHVVPAVHAPLMVTIALCTTGLGTLLPILRDGGQLGTPFGRMLLAAGTLGEIGPIVAVSLLLSTRYSTVQEFFFLLLFLALVGLAAAIGMRARPPRVLALLSRLMHSSSQLPVRLALLLMIVMFVVSVEFGFEGILGAFAAGMVVGLATRGEEGERFRMKIDAVCFGWLTPFFFIGTGIQFDPAGLTRDVATMLLVPAFFVLFLVVRGAPVYLYRTDLQQTERLPFALSASVASLGLVVVITQIGSVTQVMNPSVAQALVGAALLSNIVFPTLAGVLLSRAVRSTPQAGSA